jgi:hypothetical protein
MNRTPSNHCDVRKDGPAGTGGDGEQGIMSGRGAQVGIFEDVGGVVSGDDNIIGKPDGETGGDDGVGFEGQIIFIIPLRPSKLLLVFKFIF